MSARLKLTLSYASIVMFAGAVLLAVTWIFALRWIPNLDARSIQRTVGTAVIITGPNRSDLLRGLIPSAATALALLLVFSLVGGWLLAGRMLARLEANVAEQQRFAANASHELRTPLAIAQTLLDVARNDRSRGTAELIDRLHAVNTRAIELTEALLLLSRADQRSFTRGRVDLSLVAEEATETLLPLAEKRGVIVETSGDLAPALGSEALLLQMATNLVHNAIVHNLPEQGTVWVTAGAHARSVALTVENTGQKLTPELVSTLVEPFARGAERVRTDHAGVGLGLAIVKSIAQAHDGTLTLNPRPAGGLRVTVQLPAAPLGSTTRGSTT